MELARVKWRRQVEQPPFLSGCCSVGGTAVLLLHTVDLIGIVRSALLLLCHRSLNVSVSSMESLRCLRCRIHLLRWMEHDLCRSRKPSTTFRREIC